MDDNVVEFFRKPVIKEVENSAEAFIHDHLIPWAESKGINTSSDNFKHGGAAIMSCLNGMLNNVF